MDKIQKILIQAGRKDLAQEYYKKVAFNKNSVGIEPDKFREYIKLFNKMKNRAEFGKLQVLVDNYNLHRNETTFAKMVDDAKELNLDIAAFSKRVKVLFQTKSNLPVVAFLKKILDYAISNGVTKLSQLLRNRLIKTTFSKEK